MLPRVVGLIQTGLQFVLLRPAQPSISQLDLHVFSLFFALSFLCPSSLLAFLLLPSLVIVGHKCARQHGHIHTCSSRFLNVGLYESKPLVATGALCRHQSERLATGPGRQSRVRAAPVLPHNTEAPAGFRVEFQTGGAIKLGDNPNKPVVEAEISHHGSIDSEAILFVLVNTVGWEGWVALGVGGDDANIERMKVLATVDSPHDHVVLKFHRQEAAKSIALDPEGLVLLDVSLWKAYLVLRCCYYCF